ncbi:MAG: SurA N-terminal domain-containing protein [Bacteroidetes bacterium]|nr:SurA N-terminal domain-containing protein [Bacteroidota bacterium]
MALIGTLRNRMTKWVVGLVAVSMAAFILGSDFLGNGAQSFIGNDNSVGEIAGTTISMEDYQAAIQETENNYAMNLNRKPTEQEMPTIRQQAWDLLIARLAINPEFEKVGVKVHSEEEWDMIQGKNVEEGLKNAFKDSLGRFDRARLIQQLQVFNSFPAGSPQRAQWDIYRSNLAPARARLKYEALLLKSNYVTDTEAERYYHEQSDVAEVKYLYVPFYAVSDSLVKVTDADIKSYFDQNKEKYKTTETKSLSYVMFPVKASADDSASIKTSLTTVAENFKTTKEDSIFAVTNNTNPNVSGWNKYNASNIPSGIQEKLNEITPGTVVGPFQENGFYKVVKLISTGTDTAYFARASHILFRADDPSDAGKKATREKARKVLAELKAGADFAAKAREHGTDGTASTGGDLGWFGKGTMVKPFEKAVFGAAREGLLSDVVETDFGFHIIKVTGAKNNKVYTVASVEEEITPSDETQNEIYRQADAFASELSGVEAFREKAAKEKLIVSDANDLAPSERRLSNLPDARQIISWAYRDGSVGKVSEATDIDGNWVVAVVTKETSEGYRALDKDLKETITPLAKKQMIGKMIAEKVSGKKDDLETLAKQFGNDAIVNTSNDLRLNTNSLVSVGFDPAAVGKAFSAEAGKRSAPYIGENGVLIVEGIRKTTAPEITDFNTYKSQLLQAANSRSSFIIGEALRSAAKIEDKRYRMF